MSDLLPPVHPAPRAVRDRGDTPRSPGQGGFTLIEITVGIALLSVGLLGLASAMISATRVEQQAMEKKIALNWISSQLEKVRGLSVVEMIQAPPTGYRIDATWRNPSTLGRRTDEVTLPSSFERYFYSDASTADYVEGGTTVPLYDSNLLGLLHADDTAYTAVVKFREPTLATSGVGKNSGYWVTAVVRWKGVSGTNELKLGTFAGR